MRKSIFALLLMATFAFTFTNCKKDKDKGNDIPDVEVNTWTIDGTTHKALGAMWTQDELDGGVEFEGLIAINEATTQTVIVAFSGKPAAKGTYDLASFLDAENLSGNQAVILVVDMATSKFYTSENGGNINVSIEDGKVRINIPKVQLTNLLEQTDVDFVGILLETM